MQRQIVFKCPRTGMSVQHRLDDSSPELSEAEDVHVALVPPLMEVLAELLDGFPTDLLRRCDGFGFCGSSIGRVLSGSFIC
ncbi:hypothetical protein [Bradyrhizobium sp.]|uniref:hypothetical protein n=1 Tax=Bradyrhizobium sp. TaxID=376 RepID=UPI0026234AF7|nr:hypothetical protein [Bradyrhizobium sp.]